MWRIILEIYFRPKQGVKNQNSAESPDETNNIHFTINRTTGGVFQQVGLMSPKVTANAQNNHSLMREDSEVALGKNESKSKSESSEQARLALNTGEVLINSLVEKFSKEIAKVWSNIGGIKSSLTNRDGLRPLQQKLRLKYTTYDSTIDHPEREKACLPEVIKIGLTLR